MTLLGSGSEWEYLPIPNIFLPAISILNAARAGWAIISMEYPGIMILL
jgi:hypothetical protein